MIIINNCLNINPYNKKNDLYVLLKISITMESIVFCFVAMFAIYFLMVTNSIINFEMLDRSGNVTRHYHYHDDYYLSKREMHYNAMFDKFDHFRYRNRPALYRCRWCKHNHRFRFDDYDF